MSLYLQTTQQREHLETLGDLFSIIKTLEFLEKAYLRDSVNSKEYTEACNRLLSQYKTAVHLSGLEDFKSVEDFMREYSLNCKAAEKRLKIGVPATLLDNEFKNPNSSVSVLQTTSPNSSSNISSLAGSSSILPSSNNNSGLVSSKIAKTVAQIVQHYITLMDSLKLSMYAVDQLHPLLSDLYFSLCSLPSSFYSNNKNNNKPSTNEKNNNNNNKEAQDDSNSEGSIDSVFTDPKYKIKQWLTTMESMKASDEIDEEQVRQLLFDLESSYNAFHRTLES